MQASASQVKDSSAVSHQLRHTRLASLSRESRGELGVIIPDLPSCFSAGILLVRIVSPQETPACFYHEIRAAS